MNLAISGSCLNEWQPGVEGHNSTWKYPYDTAMQTFSYAQQIAKNEIAAGHYTLGNMAIIYHNGANFTSAIYPGWTMESIAADYETMWSGYKADLSLDIDGDGASETVEVLGLIPSWKPALNSYAYDKPAGYYMSASADYPDILIASNATRDWLTEEGLKLFPAIEYTTQSEAVTIPESVLHTDQGGTSNNSLFCSADKAHLNQVTYNAVGIDAATNLYNFLRGEQRNAATVTFKNTNGETVTALELAVNESYQLIPLTDPVYGQNVIFEVTGGLELSYPLQVRAVNCESGTLTAKVDGQTVAQIDISVTEPAHNHCVCGGKSVSIGGHSCQSIENWIPWGRSDTTALPTESGYYYLVADMELSGVSTIASGADVHLCLNGHTVTGTSRLYNIYGSLSLTDCSAAQSGTITSSSAASYGAVFYSYADSVFDMYGGTLTSTNTNLAGGIGTIGQGSDGAAYFNMYGGTITGGSVTHRGGNLYVISGSVVNIYGGLIENGATDSTNSDTSHGGNIYISSSTVHINGGTVTGGSSGLMAGNIYLASGSLNITGGTVTAGTASGGGNIAVASGKTLTITGGTVSAGTATANGGNIYAEGTVALSGGTVTGGSAVRGGGIYVSAGTFSMTGGTVSSGGNIYTAAKTELHIFGSGVIEDGTAELGGNIYSLSPVMTMYGGLVRGGKAEKGGNIAFESNVSVTLENGTVADGRAANMGGNIYILNVGTYTLSNMVLSGGTSDNDGGNLYIYRNMYGDTYLNDTTPVVTLHNTTVTGGTAGHLGGGIYNMDGLLTVSGSTSIAGNNGSNLYLDAGQTVNLADLTQDASVGVAMAVAGKISSNAEYADHITSDDTACTVTTADGYIVLQPSKAVNVPSLTAYSVGWHRGIVTSPFPVPLDGMGKNVERMETYNVLTELEASIVVIADEDGIENAVLMCTMDTIVIPEEFSNAIAAVISDATGIPADRIFIGGTHTHAAVSIDENHDSVKEYLQWLYPLMAEYAAAAVEDLSPVSSTQMIRTNADGMTQVRRYVDADGNAYSTVDKNVPEDAIPESNPDTELQAIRFVRYSTTGRDDVILVNFQSHPGHDASASNGNVSAEMWGAFRESVESQMKNTVCGFFIGAAANQAKARSTEYISADGNTYDLTNKEQYGAALAAHLITAFENPTQINTEEFDLKVMHYAFDAEGWYKDSFSGDRTRPLTLNAVSIGDFAFITAPYEMFHENGEQLKDFVYENELFDLLFVISNSNGANKYIASYQAFENDETDGKLTSFEVRQTRFNKGMAEALITAHAEMLAALSGKGVEVTDFLEEAQNGQ